VLVDGTGITLSKAIIPSLSNSAFSFKWNGALATGATYSFNYYADVDGSGTCDAPPTDHVWNEPIAAVSGPVTLTLVHTTNWTDVCSSF
jgi:hypothetical protein